MASAPKNRWTTIALRTMTVPLALILAAEPKASAQDLDELTELSLEELLDIKVTTVSRASESVLRAPAAVYVITNEDIRRSGVRNLPDALRLAPGVEVAKIENNSWAISVRGFNELFSNKLLVLVDGRSVYTPLFSGVYWDLHNPVLEDVDRIEVIRGPGASLWGSNAVNGIINIITKSSADTQGIFAEAGAGTEERGFGTLRYGGEFAEGGTYRVNASYFVRDEAVDANGDSTPGDWDAFDVGFRTDWRISEKDTLAVQGGLFRGSAEFQGNVSSVVPPFVVSLSDDLGREGAHFLARWSRDLGERGEMHLQSYYDYFDNQRIVGGESRHTGDLDFQHSLTLGGQHRVTWGLGFRYTQTQTEDTPQVVYVRSTRDDQIISAFVQDRITIVPERFDLTIGSKFEYNTFSGLEIQPTVRALWTPTETASVWGAVSRAVRTPSHAELGAIGESAAFPPFSPENPGPVPAVISFVGSGGQESEKLITFEMGYRNQVTPEISLDITAFYSIYDDLRSGELGQPTFRLVNGLPQTFVPLFAGNGLEGDSIGLEFAGSWKVQNNWRVQTTYSYFDLDVELKPGSTDFASAMSTQGSSPRHQLGLRSYWDPTGDLAFDILVKLVDELKSLDVDGYVDLDVRLAWQPIENLEIGLVGQNLLENRRAEFGQVRGLLGVGQVEVERSGYGYVKFRF